MTQHEQTTNLMEIEQLTVARLRQHMPPGVSVESLADYAETDVELWPSPSVLVVIGDFRPVVDAGEDVDVEIMIHAVVTVQSAGSHGDHDSAKNEGGTLSASVIRALHNWVPDDRYERLVLQPGQAIDFAPGRALFPTMYLTRTGLRGAPNQFDD